MDPDKFVDPVPDADGDMRPLSKWNHRVIARRIGRADTPRIATYDVHGGMVWVHSALTPDRQLMAHRLMVLDAKLFHSRGTESFEVPAGWRVYCERQRRLLHIEPTATIEEAFRILMLRRKYPDM